MRVIIIIKVISNKFSIIQPILEATRPRVGAIAGKQVKVTMYVETLYTTFIYK